jgi:hypothetical protein
MVNALFQSMKTIIVLWLFAVAIMCIVPPWQERLYDGLKSHDTGIIVSRVCAPIFHPPKNVRIGEYAAGVFSIDYRQLGIQLLGVTALAGALLVVLPLPRRLWERMKLGIIVISTILVVMIGGYFLIEGFVWTVNKFPIIVYVGVGILLIGSGLLFAAAIGQWFYGMARRVFRHLAPSPSGRVASPKSGS